MLTCVLSPSLKSPLHIEVGIGTYILGVSCSLFLVQPCLGFIILK